MEISATMARAPLFAGIPETELRELLCCVGAALRRYQKGELLLRRGDRAERMGLVLSGRVHILQEDFWGRRTLVGYAQSGDVFAEAYACLGTEALEVSVEAGTETEVLYLDAALAAGGCARACGAHARLRQNLLALLAEKNLMLTRKMGHMARRTTREKLLSFLSAQALRAGGPVFDIPLDRQGLADYLAVDRSAMSAALGKLRAEGVLAFHKNHFRLLRETEEGTPC